MEKNNEPLKIIIADDDEQNLYLLEVMLKSEKYDVTRALNGEEVLQHLKKVKYDLIISDILMPVLDGFQLCRTCKTDPILKNIPFIFYTATYINDQDKDFALSLGADRFIIKPIESVEFMNIIREIIHQYINDNLPVKESQINDEKLYFLEYSKRLSNKLENKILKLEEANKSLIKNEGRYQLFVNNSMDAIAVIQDGKFKFVNPALVVLTGYTAYELYNMPVINFIHKDYQQEINELYQKTLESKTIPKIHDYKAHTKNNKILWLESIENQIIWEEKPAIMSFIRDISEKKQIEETLRISEDKFKYIFDNSLIGKSITSPTGEIHVNKAFCNMLGYSMKELQNYKWQDITHPEDIETNQEKIASLLSGEKDSTRFIKRYIHKNGAVIWADVSTSIRRDKKGIPLYFMTVIIDITERKHAEEEIKKLNAGLEKKVIERTSELTELNKEMESFSYSVSHDLKAPLRSINGFSQILLDEHSHKLDDEGKNLLSHIQSSCKLMDMLIEDLLSLSKVTRHEINYQKIDLTDMINSIISEIKKNNPEHKVNIIINRIPEVESDYNLLNIALTNLIGNAWKFTEKITDPKIEFGNILDKNETVYFIRDNGVGFNMAYADKLFGAFQRLHTQKEFPGTGIGLAIVKRIIKRLGGRIWADAKEGKGATFYFVLPKRS